MIDPVEEGRDQRRREAQADGEEEKQGAEAAEPGSHPRFLAPDQRASMAKPAAGRRLDMLLMIEIEGEVVRPGAAPAQSSG